MRRMALALVAVLLLAASPALAGGYKGTLEIGGYYGFAWLDDYVLFFPDDDNVFGGRLGFFFSDHVSLEGSIQRIKTDTEFAGPLPPPNEDVEITSYRLNLLYNLGSPSSGVRPFLTAGVGSEKFDVPTYIESSDFSFNGGAGLRFFLGKHFNLRLDGRYVRVKVGDQVDDSQSNLEATAGLSLLLGGGPHEEVSAAPVEAPPPNQPPTVSCTADRPQVLPGETVRITATASDPEGGPVTYAWSTTAGAVAGTDAATTLDFTGATPPASATVTVRVTDDHGNSATCDATVALMEPVKPAEAVSCTAGNFPRNLSRLSNVDKACLDDVAQKLSSDPRAHVVVIGHSDSHETTKGVDQKRAEAVRDYLVKERSIDLARVTIRSSGSTKPLGADAAGNRRVEIWFVPEGAKDPE
jgi:outer membrane protein OmpA-like peptidoglycan-associated protein/opacity protein-like surface antigen